MTAPQILRTPRIALVLGAAAAVLQALMIIFFAWPAANTGPRDVPLALAGPAAAVAQLSEKLDKNAFDLETVADEAAARQAIEDRKVYGALVVTPEGTKVLVASAAGPSVAQSLSQVAASAPSQVQDVVAADPDDPRGAGFGSMLLPLVMASIAAAVLLTLLVPSPAWRAAGVAVFGLTSGLISALVSFTWLSLLPGSYLEVAAVSGLISVAVAGSVTGLASLLGTPGISLGAVTMIFIGNPLSGATSAPELLPQPWGAFGQLLPPGAGASLLRSVSFFNGAASAAPLTVLLVWAVAGLALLGLADRRFRSTPEPQPTPQPAPEPAPAL